MTEMITQFHIGNELQHGNNFEYCGGYIVLVVGTTGLTAQQNMSIFRAILIHLSFSSYLWDINI
jgi:hypothetical protein